MNQTQPPRAHDLGSDISLQKDRQGDGMRRVGSSRQESSDLGPQPALSPSHTRPMAGKSCLP